MTILSVDDSRIVRKIIKSAVDVLGYEFFEAEDGASALSLLEKMNGTVDLILLDWNMPELSGLEVLKILKEDEELSSIPVMMVTTESEKSNIVSAIRAGAINYLTKPFSSEELIGKILECVEEGAY
ncbi:MAG: response regulator [Anaerotignaceae bacterium]